MLEYHLFFHCSPSLAGLKITNLFSLSSCQGCAIEPLLNDTAYLACTALGKFLA